ncbi:hypothetical protein QJS10_CPB12g00829 [Acorus calamus]|uniref:Protein DEFECTIVE IN MERISTEM SILENCING 3 n=1 Tax=Acorus calamus TaxID=4465 RepID=A0AAV9DNW5_ACOCL|nr:hypothetical protein QJS10_CPB12g00829 [Acorus calamus]
MVRGSEMQQEGLRVGAIINHSKQTIEQILLQDQTAAGVFFQPKLRHEAQASNLPFTKDVLGVVALLGKVNDDNLSRLLSENLGLETMLAIVCKTYEGVKSLEIYGKEGMIDKTAGIHGFGPIGRPLNGRFSVICLEQLRPYVGSFLDGDSQRKLDILKPKLPGGEYPPGFLGYALNMIYVDNLALPFISDGAISLDGGIMKGTGLFFLGDRKDVEVRFPICSEASNTSTDLNTEEQLKKMEWRQERLVEDIHREEKLLNNAKLMFNAKKQEFMKFLSEGSRQVTQALEPSPRQVKPGHFEMNWS